MGARYVSFRLFFELKRRLGLLKAEYPTNPPVKLFKTLDEWRKQSPKFLFSSKDGLNVPVNPTPELKQAAEQILVGKLKFFSATEYDLSKDYDWITNVDTGYKYDINKHWTEVNDYSKEAGDIKYVWEKSRFSYLHTIIRYDYHFNVDQSAFVFNEIKDWIAHNPINQGPNYKCSQETSLRLMNWTFALHYYKNSPLLTEELFQQIMHSIYWQARHVYSNIDFSRIAVRNNHAITETFGLYFIGTLFPFFPEAKKWVKDGKKWFEQEVAYQVYEDGTFLQFSMNYHRVVVQLFSWAIRISELNNNPFTKVVYDRAQASLKFLNACMVPENGMLPNYGANDGALFFKFSDADFRDYRPQLEALAAVLNVQWATNRYEDKFWYGGTDVDYQPANTAIKINSFTKGGYYTIQEKDVLTFIRCGSHKDRPSHADNLHLDIWVNGENILRDAGSYKYNTDEEMLKYFFGTTSHNTVMLNGYDQMLKGGRFIWYYWSQALGAEIKEHADYIEFTGKVNVFQQVAAGITHTRTVKKYKNQLRWEITDVLEHNTEHPMLQIWNPAPGFGEKYRISATDNTGELRPEMQQGWHSGLYGQKERTDKIVFSSRGKQITTIIESIA